MTMTESDKVKMTINIGGEYLKLTVPFKSQNRVRDAEASVKKLYDNWRKKFPNSSSQELLAMMAYQFAYFYQELMEMHGNATESLDYSLKKLESLIGKANDCLHIN